MSRWLRELSQPWVKWPATVLVGCVAALVWLTPRMSEQPLSPAFVAIHLSLAMLALAALVVAFMSVYVGPPIARTQSLDAGSTRVRARRDNYPTLLLATTVAAYLVVLTGAQVAGGSADQVCTGFPFCDGSLGTVDWLQTAHRATMAVTAILLVLVVWQTYRLRPGTRLVPAMWGVIGLFALQSLVGLGNVVTSLAPLVRVSHFVVAAAAWSSIVALTMLAYATPQPRRVAAPASPDAPDATQTSSFKTRIAPYITLAKPRIILLLLVTTWAAMWIASPTPPSFWLVFWTMVGGALSAAGANALNMYLDRDIDVLMGRTARRPLPSHKLAPRNALWFGVILGTLSFVLMTVFVNVLSASLALAGLLFYVFIYTRMLKRTTTQNIVIGGAAGAIPPMVGWAAATGNLSLAAVWLFIIIFYWTPPHFWALALVRKTDYARAGVPMLPVVEGDAETHRQILLYSVLMVVLSMFLVPLRAMGLVYLTLALVLGGIFIWYAIQLFRQGTHAAAWKLYKYSLLYLALLFVVMVVDHTLAWSLPPTLVAALWP